MVCTVNMLWSNCIRYFVKYMSVHRHKYDQVHFWKLLVKIWPCTFPNRPYHPTPSAIEHANTRIHHVAPCIWWLQCIFRHFSRMSRNFSRIRKYFLGCAIRVSDNLSGRYPGDHYSHFANFIPSPPRWFWSLKQCYNVCMNPLQGPSPNSLINMGRYKSY